MTPPHQFSQLPTAYYRELQNTNRKKAIAFLEYAVDDFSGEMESDRKYGRLWGVGSPSTSKAWIEDFRDAIEKYHIARICFSNQNAEKTKLKKPKNSRTLAEQRSNTNRTDKSSESPVNSEFQEHQSNTNRTSTEQLSNTLTIYENVEIEFIGGEKRAYLEFRLAGEGVLNPKGLEIIILRDLSNFGTKESIEFFDWQKIKNESQYILSRLTDDFVAFGKKDRKICKEIFDDFKKDLDPKDLNLIFEIAFFDANKIILERKKIA